MVISINYPIKPVYDQDYAEMLRELSQNNDRSGFQNLGSDNSFRFIEATSSQLINAQGGNDTILIEGNTNDTVFGGSGNDNLDGGGGSDTLSGGSGTDTIFGGAGADSISGGSGADILNGDNDAVPASQHGADTINGGGGNDTIYGGGRADILTGGTGADTFLYKVGFGAGNESQVGAADHITDFQVGDRIDVSFMDADSNSANGNSAFSLSSAPSTAAGTFWIENQSDGQHVFFNINGGAADMEIVVENSAQLTTEDFLL